MFNESFKIILFIISTLVFGTLSPVVTNSSAVVNLDQLLPKCEWLKFLRFLLPR